MSEFKHTPGPWFVYRDEICYRSDADDQSYGMMCQVDFEKEANARLIAAAPELLGALRSIVEEGLSTSKISAAKAAIAKATGVQP